MASWLVESRGSRGVCYGDLEHGRCDRTGEYDGQMDMWLKHFPCLICKDVI